MDKEKDQDKLRREEKRRGEKGRSVVVFIPSGVTENEYAVSLH